jgi:hypothetical protein
MFGEDPWVCVMGNVPFSAWNYAKKRAEELINNMNNYEIYEKNSIGN